MTTNSGVDHAELSQHLIRQADEELEQDDLLQASEKGWGAAAHALKAIAEQRGWVSYEHALLYVTARQLSEESRSPELYVRFITANGLHSNFYQDFMDESAVRHSLSVTKAMLRQLEEIYASEPRPDFVPSTSDQQERLRILTGQEGLRDSRMERRRNRRRG